MGTKLRRALKVLGIAVASLAVLLVLLYALRLPLFGRFITTRIEEGLGQALGGRYSLGGVEGTLLADITLLDLATEEAPTEGSVRGLALRRAHVEYDLLGLLFGDAPLSAIERVEIEGADVRLDVTGDSEDDDGSLPSLVSDPIDDPLPSLAIHGRLELALGGAPFRVEDLAITSASKDAIGLRVARVYAGDERVEGSIEGQLERVDPSTLRWVSTTRLGEVGLPEATYLTNGRVDASLVTRGGALRVEVAPTAAKAETETLDLARLPRWVAALLPEATLPSSGAIVGSATIRGTRPLGLEADVQVRALRWHDVEARRIDILAHTDAQDIIRIDRIEAEVGEAVLRVREAHLDPTHPYWIRSAEVIEANIPDLSAVLPDYERATALQITARKADGARLELTRLDIEDPWGRVSGRGWADLPPDPADVDEAAFRLSLTAACPDLALLDVPLLTGALTLQGEVEGTRKEIRYSLVRSEGDAAIDGRMLDTLEVRGTLDDFEILRIETAALESGSTSVGLTGSVRLPGDEPTTLDLGLDVTVEDLAAWVPDEGATGTATYRGKVTGPLEDLVAEGRLRAREVAVGETRVGSVLADASLRDGTVEIGRIGIDGDQGRLDAVARVDLDPLGLRIATLEAEPTDGPRLELRAPAEIAYEEGIVRVPQLRVAVGDALVEAGELEVDVAEGRARLTTLDARQGETQVALGSPLVVHWQDGIVRAQDVSITMAPDLAVQTSLRADIAGKRGEILTLGITKGDLEAQLDAPLSIAMVGQRIDVSGLSARMSGWRIEGDLSLHPEESRAEVRTLRAEGQDLAFALAQPARVTWGDDGVAVGELALDALGGRIEGNVAWRGEALASLEARGLDLSPYVEGLEARADADLQVKGDVGRVAVRIPSLRYAGEVIAVEGVVEQQASGGIRVRGLRLRDERGSDLRGEATLPWRVSSSGLAKQDDVTPQLRLAGPLPSLSDFTPIDSGQAQLDLAGDATGLRGVLSVPDVFLDEDVGPRDDGEISFEVTPEASRASLRLADAGILAIRGDVSLAAGLTWTEPGDLEGFLDAPLEGRLTAEVNDTEPLKSYLGKLRRLEGKIAADVRVGGSLREPDLEGVLTTEDAALEISSTIPVVSSLDTRIVWRDGRVTIEQLEGEMGYAPFEIGGHVQDPLGDNPTFDVTIAGDNVLAARSDAMRLRTDLDLAIRGPLDALATSGLVRVTSLLYVKPVSMSGGGPATPSTGFQLFSIEEGPLSTMTFDVKIQADESIRIRNNLARGRMSADFVLRGTGKKPEPEGRVVAQQASVFLPVTTLHLDGAEVIFPPGDPLGPQVRATARTRASGYEIGVRIMGRLPDLDLAVYSRPRLSDEDAMLMLATGATAGAAGSSGVQSVTFQKAVEFFGKNLFSYARATADPDARPFFDRFSLTVGRERSERGNDTIETELGITDRVYLTFDRDRYDETNLGFIWRVRLP